MTTSEDLISLLKEQLISASSERKAQTEAFTGVVKEQTSSLRQDSAEGRRENRFLMMGLMLLVIVMGGGNMYIKSGSNVIRTAEAAKLPVASHRTQKWDTDEEH